MASNARTAKALETVAEEAPAADNPVTNSTTSSRGSSRRSSRRPSLMEKRVEQFGNAASIFAMQLDHDDETGEVAAGISQNIYLYFLVI